MRAVFLFCLTPNMALPWAEAGVKCLLVDQQHPPGLSSVGHPGILAHGADLRTWRPPRNWVDDVVFVAAFPPCDHLAVSGARWFKGKGLRKLAGAVELVSLAADWCEWFGAPYLIENPVSTLSTYWRAPDHSFHPWQFCGLEPSDCYTKKTNLWTGGGFVMPAPNHPAEVKPDDRIHKAPPSPERANFRSATPMGFARAVFEANKPTQLRGVA